MSLTAAPRVALDRDDAVTILDLTGGCAGHEQLLVAMQTLDRPRISAMCAIDLAEHIEAGPSSAAADRAVRLLRVPVAATAIR